MAHLKAIFHLENIIDVAELLRRPHLCQIVILLKQDYFKYKEISPKSHCKRPRTSPPGYVGMLSAASCPQAQNLGKQRIWGRVEGGRTLGK